MSTASETTWEHIRYEQPAERVARIVLARPQAANAQNYQMLSELNQAFDRAARDESVRVIILAADGKHFSSGHDLRAGTDMDGIEPVGTWCCFDAPGAEGYMATEAEMYIGLCWRWRNIPKPTIAQVQGKVIAGGLMLVWPMDLVVCSDDATFSDPVVAFGVNGHEYFTHPFEAGARLAKEMLFTGRPITADEAYRRGMVNQVVPGDELASATLALAEHIARRPMIGLTLAKQSVNNTLDAMGMYTAIQSAFGLHHVGHNHNLRLFDSLVDPSGLQVIRDEA
jgi:enoyl-CoA hydratase